MRFKSLVVTSSVGLLVVSSVACASAVPALRHRSGPYALEVVSHGRRAPVFVHRGESYVMGCLGCRYTLRVHNRSARRAEVVVTVDGRDVLDGKPGNWGKRGYIVPAWGTVEIDGWRLSTSSVAAFRFSSVASSYAAKMGSARDVGVIGVAVFPERGRQRPAPRSPCSYGGYDCEPEYRGYMDDVDSVTEEGEARADRSSSAPLSRGASAEALSGQPTAKAEQRRPSGESRSMARRKRGWHDDNDRPGLATAFGERRYSAVEHVSFVRAHASRPSVLLGVRYNDRRGLIAMGVDLGARYCRTDSAKRTTASPFPAEPRASSYAEPPPGWDD